jgi:hypothetical protein
LSVRNRRAPILKNVSLSGLLRNAQRIAAAEAVSAVRAAAVGDALLLVRGYADVVRTRRRWLAKRHVPVETRVVFAGTVTRSFPPLSGSAARLAARKRRESAAS